MHASNCLPAAIIAASLNVAAIADDHIENIVSTANRTPMAQSRIGSAVSVVNRSQIDARQSAQVSDLIQDLPGIAVSRASGPGSQTQVRVRGAEANQLLVLIDGVAANNPSGADEFNFASLTAWDVEKIEVVRGPQSALWGSDALAGVINITTRNGGEEPLRGGLFLEGGSFDTINGGGSVGLNTGRLSTDLNVSWYDSAGVNIAREGDEKDGYDNLTVGLNSSFQATDTLRLGFAARQTEASNDYDDTSTTGLPVDADLTTDNRLTFLRADASLALLDQRLNQDLQFSYADTRTTNKDQGSTASTDEGERFGVYWQASWDFTPLPNEYRATVAVDYDKEEFETSAPVFGGLSDQQQDRDSIGYVTELLAQPLESLNLSASLRHDDNSDFKDKTTYRLTGTWRIDASDSRLHASYGTGMKKPTFTELFGFFPGSFIGNPDLKPEESRGGDIGFEQGWLDGRLTTDLTWFYAELTDEIRTVFLPGFQSTAINSDGHSRRQGVEATLRGRLRPGLEATASYTYTDSEEPDDAGGKQTETRRPRHMAALNLDYRMLNDRVGLNLNLSYTGEQTDQDFSVFPSPYVTLDDYTLVNIAASYAASDTLTIYARAENLFDEDYENLFGFRTPGAGYYAGIRMNLR